MVDFETDEMVRDGKLMIIFHLFIFHSSFFSPKTGDDKRDEMEEIYKNEMVDGR